MECTHGQRPPLIPSGCDCFVIAPPHSKEDGSLARAPLGDIVNRPHMLLHEVLGKDQPTLSPIWESNNSDERPRSTEHSATHIFDIFEDDSNSQPQVAIAPRSLDADLQRSRHSTTSLSIDTESPMSELSALEQSPDSWSPLVDDAARSQEPVDYMALSFFDQLPPAFVNKLKVDLESMETLQRQRLQQSRTIRNLRRENAQLRRQCKGSLPAEAILSSSVSCSSSSSSFVLGNSEKGADTPVSPQLLSEQEAIMNEPVVLAEQVIVQTATGQGLAMETEPRIADIGGVQKPQLQHLAMERRLRVPAGAASVKTPSIGLHQCPVSALPIEGVTMPLQTKSRSQEVGCDMVEPDPATILLQLREHRSSMDRHCTSLQMLLFEAASFSSDMHRVQLELQETRINNEGMLRRIEAAICEESTS